MKRFNYKIFSGFFLVLFAALVLTGCDKDDDTPAAASNNLDQLITGNPELSIFAAALEKTKLNSFTKGGGPFTIFAPTNAAFAAIGIASPDALSLIDSNRLVVLLTYHIQAGARSYTEIPLGPNATMVTQGGFTQYASRYVGGSAFINGAKISGPNNLASNGYLHIIDRVLIPGTATSAVTLATTGNYKLMLQALTKTSVAITANPYTIFAVPNSVMTAQGYDSTTIANLVAATPAYTTLQGIMRYHLVAQRIFSSDFKAGNLKTVQGTNLVIGLGSTITVKGTNNPSPLQIVAADGVTSTGVIHSINGLLRP